MNATLPQIQAKLAEVSALRDDALETVCLLALGRIEADRALRAERVSKFQGYEHEFWALVKIERELVAHGRAPASSRELRTANREPSETRFDAPQPVSAVTTLPASADAPQPPREAPRNEIYGHAWGDPATAEMIAHHYVSGDGF